MQRSVVLALSLALAGCAGTEPLLTAHPPSAAPLATRASASAAANQETEIRGGSEAELREFAARALTYNYPGAPEGKTLILVGSLPEDLPFSLQLPENARIVGSIARPGDGGTEMILDVPLAPEAAVAFFDEQFVQAGWERFEAAQGGTGFVAASWPSATFCLKQDRATIYLSTVPLTDEATDVRINVQQPAQYSPCEQGSYGPLDDPMRLIPELRSPPGSTIQGGGGGSSSDGSAEVTTSVITELSALELAAFYGEQLAGAGWQQIEQGTGSRVAWSAWTISDDEDKLWNGLFLAIESPFVLDKRSLSFQIERAD